MTPKRIVSTASALTAICLVAAAATAHAQDSALPAGFKTQPLLKSGQTRDKQPIAYPKTDKPEIISVIGIIEPGGRTPLHEHPVPTYVYVFEDEVEFAESRRTTASIQSWRGIHGGSQSPAPAIQ